MVLFAGCDRRADDGHDSLHNLATAMNATLLVVRWTGGGFTREYGSFERCVQARDVLNNDSAARLAAAEIAYRDDHDQPATKIANFAVAVCVPA